MSNALDSEVWYRQELLACHKLTHEQEQYLLQRARQGDKQAKEALLCSLLPAIREFAYRYARQYTGASSLFSPLEFASVGNTVLVEQFETALRKANPCAWLLSYTYGQIRQYHTRFRSLITVPSCYVGDITFVDSLDAPCYQQNDEEDSNPGTLTTHIALSSSPAREEQEHAALYEVLSSLSTQNQELLYRLFGLCGYGSETLRDIVGEASSSPAYINTMQRLSVLRKQLRGLLAAHYPELAHRPEKALRRRYETVHIRAHQRARIEHAIEAIRQRGEKPTVRRIQMESHLNSTYISAYLHSVPPAKEQSL